MRLGGTLNFGLAPTSRAEFYTSSQCVNLRIACSTDEFRRQLKEAYVKYLVEMLCIKSRQTRNSVFWLFNFLKKVKLFHVKKSFFSSNALNYSMLDNSNEQESSANRLGAVATATEPFYSTLIGTNYEKIYKHSSHHQKVVVGGREGGHYSPFLLTTASSTSIFEFKLFYYYNINNLNMPLIPFSYDIQKVFHSVSFAYLLDLLGIVRTDKSFPYIPKEWFHKGRRELNECLDSLEKCLCI